MKFEIAHELPGRLRLRCGEGAFTLPESLVVASLLEQLDGVERVKASFRTGSLLILHNPRIRDTVLEAVRTMGPEFYGGIDGAELADSPEGGLWDGLWGLLGGVFVRSLLPSALRYSLTVLRSVPLLVRGTNALCRRKLNVSVLDASAVGVSLLRRDFRTATVITTLLALGDLLEEWTHKRSRESLSDSLMLDIDKLWVRRDGADVQIPFSDLKLEDLAVVRMGAVIPVDGVVEDGEGMVNQSAMTGESMPVHRRPGLSVYAGTVVEEGELVIRVTAFDSETRIHKIAQMIDESEMLKAEVQNRAERMADEIVPYSFLLAGLTYLLTGDAVRASSALLVDYSCAIRLATPLAILAAMREGAKRGVLIKGGKFLEALAGADTVVFDKTGTLTVSSPRVADVIPFGGRTRQDVLRVAACLEEHFPHSIARAVVRQAELEGLHHREEHTEVEYAVAHGIVSLWRGRKVLIGSAHFVFEDEGIVCSAEARKEIDRVLERYSVLYLAMDGELAGLLCIEDPLRPDAGEVVDLLHKDGVRRVVLMTGDEERVARNVAGRLSIDEFHARMLPDEKTRFVERFRTGGSGVVMVGDGINDSPALSAADVGVAMRSGADIAREVADVVLSDNRLSGITDARRLGRGVMRKIYGNYAMIVGVNTVLLGLGILGGITPVLSALLHNLTTVGAALYALTPVLKQGRPSETGRAGCAGRSGHGSDHD